jgi:hypothetical protein
MVPKTKFCMMIREYVYTLHTLIGPQSHGPIGAAPVAHPLDLIMSRLTR